MTCRSGRTSGADASRDSRGRGRFVDETGSCEPQVTLADGHHHERNTWSFAETELVEDAFENVITGRFSDYLAELVQRL